MQITSCLLSEGWLCVYKTLPAALQNKHPQQKSDSGDSFHPVLWLCSLIISVFRNSPTDKESVLQSELRFKLFFSAEMLFLFSFNCDRAAEGGRGGAEERLRLSITSCQQHIQSWFVASVLRCGSTRHHPGVRSVYTKLCGESISHLITAAANHYLLTNQLII